MQRRELLKFGLGIGASAPLIEKEKFSVITDPKAEKEYLPDVREAGKPRLTLAKDYDRSNLAEVVRWPIYDRVSLKAGDTIPDTIKFFSVPMYMDGKTLADTNMCMACMLPQLQWYQIRSLRITFSEEYSRHGGFIREFVNTHAIEVIIGSKIYLQRSLSMWLDGNVPELLKEEDSPITEQLMEEYAKTGPMILQAQYFDVTLKGGYMRVPNSVTSPIYINAVFEGVLTRGIM